MEDTITSENKNGFLGFWKGVLVELVATVQAAKGTHPGIMYN